MTEHLYKISDNLVDTIEAIMENGGELTEELEKRFDQGQASLKAKGENLVHFYLNLDGNIDAIDKEISRLQQLKRVKGNKSDWAKRYLKENMERTKITKIEAPTFTISIAKNPPSAKIVDEKALPAEYVEIRPTTHVDKKAILVALKAGKEVSGAILVDDKTNLRVK
jgi:hypothetical protein